MLSEINCCKETNVLMCVIHALETMPRIRRLFNFSSFFTSWSWSVRYLKHCGEESKEVGVLQAVPKERIQTTPTTNRFIVCYFQHQPSVTMPVLNSKTYL